MKPPAQAIKPKERDTIIQALSAGVVPRVGLRHIQVGRKREVEANDPAVRAASERH